MAARSRYDQAMGKLNALQVKNLSEPGRYPMARA
jgi:hypothetical protein